MYKICIITTMYTSIRNWIEPLLPAYLENGFDVTIVANFKDKDYKSSLENKFKQIRFVHFPFYRGINFKNLFRSIKYLIKFFKEEKFDLVQYSTPNASLCSSYAAKKAKVPVRLYCQWGMVFSSRKGISRFIFKTIEKKISKWSTNIQPDSKGNLDYCRKEKIYSQVKSNVVWNGSAKGLDISKYNIENKQIFSEEIKARHKIPSDNFIIGFVGRLGKEKGCNELFLAFKILEEKYPKLTLLFVGPIEKEKTIEPQLLKYFYENEKIIITNRVPDVEKYISAMDVFVLPSYREGFGMSVIEASAMEVPVICTKYPGPSSAILENETGLLIDIGDVDGIVQNIENLISNKELCVKLGKNGRKFVINNFEQKVFIKKLIEDRIDLIKNKK